MATQDVLNAAVEQLQALATPSATVTQLQSQIAALQQELASLQAQLVAAQGGQNSDAVQAQAALRVLRQTLNRGGGGRGLGLTMPAPTPVTPAALTVSFSPASSIPTAAPSAAATVAAPSVSS